MTSVTHAAASSSILPGHRAHAAPSAGRFRFGADSKAVRMGLGVAIAAVLAGDVYAVLRSPLSEGGSTARGAASSAATASAGDEGTSGFVATNPFGEAAYGATLRSRFVAPVASAAADSGTAVDSAVTPSGVAPVLTEPAVSTPSLSGPVAPVTSFLAPAGPSNTAPQDTDPQPGLLAPVVELVPQAAPVATIVEDVIASVPSNESAPASAAEDLPIPVVAPDVPGGLPL